MLQATSSAIRQKVSLVGAVTDEKLEALLVHLRTVMKQSATPLRLHVNVFQSTGRSPVHNGT
jgi:hypothetical protein